jgi:hypothetical protein
LQCHHQKKKTSLGFYVFALYQGTTSVVPLPGQNGQGFSPCHREIRHEIPNAKTQG